jgi:hypothetical protein
MLVYPDLVLRFRRVLPCFLLVALCVPDAARARIGDTPEQMNGRMLQPGLGRVFTWPRNLAPRELERLERDDPLKPFEHLLPSQAEGWDEDIFWKSAVRGHLDNEDGWRVHVHYLKGRSVLELYRRVGPGLTEAELNAILALMRGNQTWRRVPREQNERAEAEDSVLGYEYELGTGPEVTLRARRQGNWLIIYHKRLDELLLARKAQWDAAEAQRRAERTAEQERLAPSSIDGF